MAIYLKKMPDGTVEAFGDLASLDGEAYDLAVTNAQWNEARWGAHVEAGQIVLGHSQEGLAQIVREERNVRLERDCDAVTVMMWSSMTETERTAWAQYRQALLDIPQQEGFPWDGVNVPWPTKPGE